jgi:organic radical activating enzyme
MKNGQFGGWRDKQFSIVLCTLASRLADRLEWRYYTVDSGLREVLTDAAFQKAIAKLTLISTGGEPIAVDRFAAHANRFRPEGVTLLLPVGGSYWHEVLPQVQDGDNYKPENTKLVFIAPVFLERDWQFFHFRHNPTLTFSRTIALAHEEIKKVSKVKCEFMFEKADQSEK